MKSPSTAALGIKIEMQMETIFGLTSELFYPYDDSLVKSQIELPFDELAMAL